jgi:hypothetical protein
MKLAPVVFIADVVTLPDVPPAAADETSAGVEVDTLLLPPPPLVELATSTSAMMVSPMYM